MDLIACLMMLLLACSAVKRMLFPCVQGPTFDVPQTHIHNGDYFYSTGNQRESVYVSPARPCIFLQVKPDFLKRIHHPFLLSDNRHYTFYIWRRIYMFHPIVPYLLIPAYVACAWAWFLRVGT